MMKLCKSILLMITLLCISNSGFSQSNEIRIRFIANCGLHITDGNSNIYIDFPYKSGAYHIYDKYDKSEIDSIKDSAIFIFTHKHWDHYSRKLVRKCKSTGKVYGPWNVKDLKQEDSSIQDFSIQSFKTSHKYSYHHYSYLISWHGKRIFISGDTENADTIATLKNIDWAFMPVWLWIDAKEKALNIDTKMVGLYHIGPKDRITTENPKIHLMDKKGDIISIPF